MTKYITKTFLTLKEAEKYQNKLYEEYHEVKITSYPLFSENGNYTFFVSDEPNGYVEYHSRDFAQKSIIVFDDKDAIYKEQKAKISIDYTKKFGGAFEVSIVVNDRKKIATVLVLPNGEVNFKEK